MSATERTPPQESLYDHGQDWIDDNLECEEAQKVDWRQSPQVYVECRTQESRDLLVWVERLTEDFSDCARDKIVDEAARWKEEPCCSSLVDVSSDESDFDEKQHSPQPYWLTSGHFVKIVQRSQRQAQQ